MDRLGTRGKAEAEAAEGTAPFLFQGGRVEEPRFVVPHGYEAHSQGYARQPLIDRSAGSVHMGVGVCRLESQGHIENCVHAYETGICLLAGDLEIKLGAEAFHLVKHDYALVPFAASYALRNVGDKPARWFEMLAPQFPEQHPSRNYPAWERMRMQMQSGK